MVHNAMFDDQPRDSSGVTVSPRFAMKADSFVETGVSAKNQLKAFESRNGLGSSGMTAENSLLFDQANTQSNDDHVPNSNRDKKEDEEGKMTEFKSSEIELNKADDIDSE